MTSFCGVTRAMLEAGKNLKLVFMMRSGWENCNVKAAKELGIPVCNCPSRLAEPGRRSDGRDDDLRVPRHPGAATATFSTVSGTRTISTTTRRTPRSATYVSVFTATAGSAAPSAKRLIKGFGAEVVAYDEYCTPELMMADGVKPVSLDELLSTSDIVSIHLRLVEATKNIIGKEAFAKMKPTAIFCNTARAGLVDQQALCEALQSKKIRGAVLDVFWDEPVPKDSPFLKMNNVTMTPHRAGVTTDIVPNTYNLMIQDLRRFWAGEPLKFLVKE